MSAFVKALWITAVYMSVAYTLFKRADDGRGRKITLFFSATWLLWFLLFVCFVVGASMDALTKPSPRKK